MAKGGHPCTAAAIAGLSSACIWAVGMALAGGMAWRRGWVYVLQLRPRRCGAQLDVVNVRLEWPWQLQGWRWPAGQLLAASRAADVLGPACCPAALRPHVGEEATGSVMYGHGDMSLCLHDMITSAAPHGCSTLLHSALLHSASSVQYHPPQLSCAALRSPRASPPGPTWPAAPQP